MTLMCQQHHSESPQLLSCEYPEKMFKLLHSTATSANISFNLQEQYEFYMLTLWIKRRQVNYEVKQQKEYFSYQGMEIAFSSSHTHIENKHSVLHSHNTQW